MNDSLIRQMKLTVGTQIGLSGDYNNPSAWGEVKLLLAHVSNYLILERHDDIFSGISGTNSDIALFVIRNTPITLTSNTKLFIGNQFLLLNRYPDGDWDTTDPVVHVFGVQDIDIDSKYLPLTDWHDKAVWLSSAAIMCVLDSNAISEFGAFIREKYESI
jgi:hypothetical protein